ncbi:enoyl-CoA hydratase-related protein [Brevibacterium moorei]|uniref:enoyl-CoA hydratase-related protein n=1 Tax=Brevibacterium moorei TaxID=2968457 RepID=UPI00211BE3AF|nr:enoyl-CoA hydratase-related protein [Brevibacterium sp. 68QC2CO]MCQ9385215.1 enoyl-CoA hydratase-related protein [Brevibacterium sp. 68QC2CO]
MSEQSTTATHGTVVTTLREDGVAHVRLNRPERLNSLTAEVFADLVEAGTALRGRAEVRAVALTGTGRGFCSGLDMGEFSKMVDGTAHLVQDLAPLGPVKALAQQAVYVWQLLEVPVVAGIDTVAMGGGLQLALAADIRVAQPNAKLSMMEINWGLVPDMCGTQLLPPLVGLGRAKHLIMTGRTVLGSEALSLGLVEELAEQAAQRALELAGELAAGSRPALVYAKELTNLAVDPSATLETGFAREQDAIGELIGGAEQERVVARRMAQLKARKG